MKEYELTVERTYRIRTTFFACDDKTAEMKAGEIAANISDETFMAGGDCDGDYTLHDETGRCLLDWND